MSAKPKIVVYGSECCSCCSAARILLGKKGLEFKDVLISNDREAEREMQQLSGHRSVPQIFINDKAIGGFDELYELEQSGQLDNLLFGTEETTEQ